MAVTFRANVSGYETARVTVNPNTTNIEDAEGVENAEDYSGTTMVDDEKKPQAEVVKPEGRPLKPRALLTKLKQPRPKQT